MAAVSMSRRSRLLLTVSDRGFPLFPWEPKVDLADLWSGECVWGWLSQVLTWLWNSCTLLLLHMESWGEGEAVPTWLAETCWDVWVQRPCPRSCCHASSPQCLWYWGLWLGEHPSVVSQCVASTLSCQASP